MQLRLGEVPPMYVPLQIKARGGEVWHRLESTNVDYDDYVPQREFAAKRSTARGTIDSNFERADTFVSKIIELRRQYDKEIARSTNGMIMVNSSLMLKELFLNPVEKLMDDLVEAVRGEDEEHVDAFDIMIQAAGPRTLEFLECFYLTVDAQDYEGTIAHRRFQFDTRTGRMARGPLQLCVKPPTGYILGRRERKFWERLAPAKSVQPACVSILDHVKLQEFEFHWIFLDSIVHALGPYESDREEDPDVDSARGRQCLDNIVQILRSFLKVDNDQYVFETVPARALIYRAREVVKVQFVYTLIVDVTCVLCLVFMTFMWNLHPVYMTCAWNKDAQSVSPSACASVFVCYVTMLICNSSHLVVLLCDILIHICEGKFKEWCGFWNSFDLFLESFSICLIVSFIFIDYSHPDAPNFLLPIVIVTRWIKFGSYVLYFQDIGLPSLPALLAVSSTPSFAIFSIIMIVTVACTHGYLGFRVQEDGMTLGQYGLWGLLTAFMRVCRVIMLADGEPNHLAGRLESVSDEGNGTWIIDDEDEGTWGTATTFKGHLDDIEFLTWGALIIGIVLMNTYVGVLSQKYYEYESHRFHYFHQWRVQWQIRAILRRKTAGRCIRRVTRLKPMQSYHGIFPDLEGLWLVHEPRPRNESQEQKKHLAGLQEDIREIHKHCLRYDQI